MKTSKNIRFVRVLSCLALYAAASSCAADPPPESNWSEASYGSQSKGMEVTDVQRRSFARMVSEEIQAIQTKLDRWKNEAKGTTGDKKEEKYEIIAELEELVDKVRGHLTKLQVVGKGDYWEAREDLDESLETLRQEFREAETTFQ